jgi:hypothetical protein
MVPTGLAARAVWQIRLETGRGAAHSHPPRSSAMHLPIPAGRFLRSAVLAAAFAFVGASAGAAEPVLTPHRVAEIRTVTAVALSPEGGSWPTRFRSRGAPARRTMASLGLNCG